MKPTEHTGYTLLEVTISFGLLLLLITLTLGMSRYVTNANERARVQAELFHQATVSMEFIAAHVDTAYRLEPIDAYPLPRGLFFQRRALDGKLDTTQILFRETTGRLYLGGFGNEISRYLHDFQLEVRDGLLFVHLTTMGTITHSPVRVAPIQLSRVFDISTKFSPMD